MYALGSKVFCYCMLGGLVTDFVIYALLGSFHCDPRENYLMTIIKCELSNSRYGARSIAHWDMTKIVKFLLLFSHRLIKDIWLFLRFF